MPIKDNKQYSANQVRKMVLMKGDNIQERRLGRSSAEASVVGCGYRGEEHVTIVLIWLRHTVDSIETWLCGMIYLQQIIYSCATEWRQHVSARKAPAPRPAV